MPPNKEHGIYELRQRAEDLIAKAGQKSEDLSGKEAIAVIHELRVHQIELELQNEELRRTQTELQKITDNYSRLYNNAPAGYLTVDHSGLILQANNTFVGMIHSEQHLLIGTSFFDLIQENDRSVFISRFRAFYNNPARKNIELHLLTDKYRPFYASLEGLTDYSHFSPGEDGGDNGKLLIIVTDISKRKEAEKALYESERFLRSTLDGLSANIALLNEYGEIVLVNKAWRDFADNNGGSSEVVSEGGNYINVCIDATEDRATEAKPFADGIRRVLSGQEEIFTMEYPCDAPDEKRWFIGRVTPFPGDGPKHVVVAHEDITTRKLAEEAVLKSLKEKEVLLKEIHHRVKNNMTSIHSILSLQEIQEADNRIKSVLRDSMNRITAIASIHEATYRSENLSEISLKEYVQRLLDLNIRTFSATIATPTVIIQISDDLFLPLEQTTPIGLVLNEIITNILKYAFPDGDGGVIAVQAEMEGKDMKLVVRQ